MKKITICDYIGNCDNRDIPTGHAVKTINETVEMLSDSYKVSIIVTSVYKKYVDNSKVKYILKHNSSIHKQQKFLCKIVLRIKKIKSIGKILSTENNVWFINTDFWLFIVLFVYPNKKNQKIYVTNYIDYYSGKEIIKKIKNFIYYFATKKANKVFVTDKHINYKNHIFVPDYWFDKEKYVKYINTQKHKAVYMCGGINDGKDIFGTIKAFNVNGISLTIRGKFSSVKIYEEVCRIANENIVIENKRLSMTNYYTNIGSYKFILLPYKLKNYSNRSSGIILEALFLDTIVIAPYFLLKQLGIEGIGYEDIQELNFIQQWLENEKLLSEIVKQNRKYLDEYDYTIIKKRYLDAID